MKPVVNSQVATAEETLSLERKQDFIRSALPEMVKHTFPYICSVIGIMDPQTGRHCGSALRCKLNGQRAILTALHVLKEARQEPHGLAISTSYGQPPYIVHGNLHIDPVADLAVYFLPDDYSSPEEVFWPARRIDRTLDKLATDYLFLHGFPGSRSYTSHFLKGVVSKSLPYGAMQRLENLPPDLQPWQFAIEYDPTGMMDEIGAAADLVDPHGLSGSPVWRIGVSGRSSKEWTASDCLLVGVVTSWRPDEKVLIATSTQKIPADW